MLIKLLKDDKGFTIIETIITTLFALVIIGAGLGFYTLYYFITKYW